jgi:hypothetical protein
MINEFDDLLSTYVYAWNNYENSRTCSSETYKRQEQDKYTAEANLKQFVENLIEKQRPN